jgi:transcriptional regulator with GAF, ATPase, and Fis domain
VSDPQRPPAESPADLKQRVAELSTLYEIARDLVGAHERAQLATRVVLSGMGVLGVRSGAMFVADARGRYRLLHTTAEAASEGASLQVPAAAREWMLREGTFAMGPAAARGLGSLRDELVEGYDAAIGAAIPDAQGLAAILVFGPRLLPGEFDGGDITLLDALGALASQALAAFPAEGEAAARKPRGAARPARSMEALRRDFPPLRTLVGDSAALLETCQDLLAVAPTHFPVLLMGESGVGKELAANAVHELSERPGGPFEVVDCGSIPRELIESELFGHVRGAFTGAHRDRRGAFELAHQGTIFLDEIGEMPLQLQTRLLRVLQERRFRRVGDEQTIEVDVRVVAATNRDLKADVAARRFREDLYYRLNVFAVRIPPLRDRISDLRPLVLRFLEQQGETMGVREWRIHEGVLGALETYSWPGNIRELGNLVAALAVRARDRGEIALADLDSVWRRQHAGEEPPWLARSIASSGRLGQWVLEQARASRFNLVEAARLLQRKSRSGHKVPLTERSALAYYLTGEILRALVEAAGDPDRAARAVAGDEDLAGRVAGRVAKVCTALRDGRGSRESLKRRFGKLPAGYEEALEQAARLVSRT